MDIETIPEWLLDKSDDAEIASLLQRCFDTDFGGRSFFQTRHHLRFVYRHGHIVGHMAMQFRAMRLGAGLITVAGLADVATDPDFRGKGIAGALLDAALMTARASVAEYFLLFGTAGLYQAAGFRPVHNALIWLHMAEVSSGKVKRAPAEGLQMLPLRDTEWDETSELDLLGNSF